ncbi:ATP-binding cassette domain-containing protein [Desulfococcaceae bacterium HSG7]|nr:ATP-binding cassette domain-containing protein [Desulfococcaceae bacterium HSG7]
MPDKDIALLNVTGLKRYFDVSRPFLNRIFERQKRQYLKAVNGVSFSIKRGETFALVGESGCGKSTVAHLVVGLFPPSSGKIEFDSINMTALKNRAQLRPVRRRMAMIFQDPYASLNPRWRVSNIISEPIKAFGLIHGRRAIIQRTSALLEQVGLSPQDSSKFPHEFSGGQRQRISIARALAGEPEFIVCDEPTSALDVSVQAQILNLIKNLQTKFGLSYLFISHDLAVVRHIADHVGVMYMGRLCEVAPVNTLFQNPCHPYTQMLLETIPDIEKMGSECAPTQGEIPNPLNPPSGCAFHLRCPQATDHCINNRPELENISSDVKVACFQARS